MVAGAERFRDQVEALRQGKFSYQAAKLLADSIKTQIEHGSFTWEDLGTTAVELDNICIKIRLNPNNCHA